MKTIKQIISDADPRLKGVLMIMIVYVMVMATTVTSGATQEIKGYKETIEIQYQDGSQEAKDYLVRQDTVKNVLKELDASLRGNYYLLRCPECGKKEAFLYLDDIKKFQKNSTYKIPIRCNRMNKCGKITYLNDIIDVPIQIQKMPKEKSPVQISEEGINFIRSFVHYSVETIHCEYKDFDFDIRGISNKTLKENGVFYYSKGFEQIVNSDELKRSFSKKYRNKSYKGRNIFIPIFDIDGKLVRILLRSTKNVEKKEIGLMLIQGSTEFKRYFRL